MSINPYIRDLLRRDLFSVLQIEQSNSLCPWTEKRFTRFMQDRGCGIVAEYRERILGYALYQHLPQLRIGIVEISVHREYKHRGVGTALLDYITEQGIFNNYHQIVYYVAESNLPAQLFLREEGFKAVKIHRDFFDENDQIEDAYEMALDISLHNRASLNSKYAKGIV